MENENNEYETSKQQTAEDANAANTARGPHVCGHAKHVVSEVYDKTAHAVGKTYEHAKSYSNENPGKTIFIALGIGVGLGFLLGAKTHHSHHSRSGRFAQPVVSALSDIALEFFR